MGKPVNRSWLLSVTVICLILGAMLALQFRTQLQIGNASLARRSDVMAQLLAQTTQQAKAYQDEIGNLRWELNTYRTSITKKEELLGLVNQRLENDQIALGLTDVKGPGISISIEDSSLRTETHENVELFLLHDYDLWPLVNELRAAGAEAISINDQRLVGTSAVRCAGSVINVNGVPVTSPFVILAIGHADTLYGALTITDGALDRLKAMKFPVSIMKRPDIVIKAIGVEPKFTYARPVKPSPQPRRPGAQ